MPHRGLMASGGSCGWEADGTEMEMPGSVVGGVDRGLARADVVRPDRGAGVLHALRDQAAAREEIDEGWKEWFQ